MTTLCASKTDRQIRIVQAIHRYDEALDRYLELRSRPAPFDAMLDHAEADCLRAESRLYEIIEPDGIRPVVYSGHAYIVNREYRTVNRIDINLLDGSRLF